MLSTVATHARIRVVGPRSRGRVVSTALAQDQAGSPVGLAPALPPGLYPALEVWAQRQALRQLRSADPSQAQQIRWHALRRPGHVDQAVLLRRHRNTRAVRLEAPPGAYSRIPSWGSRALWLRALECLLRQRTDVLSHHHVSAAAVTGYAEAVSAYAEQATGRRCIVANRCLRELTGLSDATADRARRVLDTLGLRVVVLAGRRLQLGECLQARSRGCRQTGFANEIALTIPASLWITLAAEAPTLFHEPPTIGNSAVTFQADVATSYPQDDNNARPPAAQHQPRGSAPKPRPTSPATDDLITGLHQRIPWLRGEQPTRLRPLLTKYADSPLRWTVHDIITTIDQRNQREGWTSLTTGYIRTRPAALLAFYLNGIDPQADHPRAQDYLLPRQSAEEHLDTAPAATSDQVHATAAAVRDRLAQQRCRCRVNPDPLVPIEY